MCVYTVFISKERMKCIEFLIDKGLYSSMDDLINQGIDSIIEDAFPEYTKELASIMEMEV